MDEMHETTEETYLGDQINSNAKHASTISKRRAKGFGIISDILQILDVIGDNRKRIEVGLILRQAWFINALLVNMEAWHNVLKKDTDIFTKLDHYLMRKILGTHSKVPSEMLYLETATIPIEFILASRRINFLHNILIKENTELTKRVYEAQVKNPCKGDWSMLVKEDMVKVGITLTDTEISEMSKPDFKQLVRKAVKNATFISLKVTQSEHTKIQNIIYNEFNIQPYLKSDCFSIEEASILFNMRASTLNGFKMCFPSVYRNDKQCKLQCLDEDTIEHTFTCHKLKHQDKNPSVHFSAIFASVNHQKNAVSKFIKLLTIRSALLEAGPAYQGIVLDTAASATAGVAGEGP